MLGRTQDVVGPASRKPPGNGLQSSDKQQKVLSKGLMPTILWVKS